MRATYLYGAGDVRVITVPDPKVELPTDALVRVTRACVCGSDLHPYHSAPVSEEGGSIGHELIGVVEEIGREVTTVAPGDFVIAAFAISCGVCEFCRAGLQTSCVNGGFWNDPDLGTGGGQAEAVAVAGRAGGVAREVHVVLTPWTASAKAGAARPRGRRPRWGPGAPRRRPAAPAAVADRRGRRAGRRDRPRS